MSAAFSPLVDSSPASASVEYGDGMLKHQTLLVGELELFLVDLIGKRNYCVLEVNLSELFRVNLILLKTQLFDLLASA